MSPLILRGGEVVPGALPSWPFGSADGSGGGGGGGGGAAAGGMSGTGGGGGRISLCRGSGVSSRLSCLGGVGVGVEWGLPDRLPEWLTELVLLRR